MRRTLAPLGALLLAAALAVVPSAPSAAETPTVSSSSAKPTTKTVTRKYGAGPVRQDDKNQKLKIRFEGRKGDKVLVTQARPGNAVSLPSAAIELTGPRGEVRRGDRPWWKLPRDGSYTFHLESYFTQPIAAQLTKLRFVDIERDAPARTLAVRRGFVWAAGFEVPQDGLLSGSVLGEGSQLLVRPDKGPFFAERYTLLLGDGMPATIGSPNGYPRSRAQHAGAVMRLLTAGGVASAVTPARVTGALDGAPVPVDTTSAHVVEVVLDGTAGQWFSTDSPPADTVDPVTVLQGTDGKYVDPTPRFDLWQLTQTGQSRLLVFPRQGFAPTTLQLSSVALGPTLVPGAAPVTVTADPAGRGTILPVDQTSSSLNRLGASNSTLTASSWYAVLLKAHVPAYPRSCLGCADFDYVGADAKNPVSQSGSGGWVYLPPSNGTGSVDLRLNPPS